MAKFPVDVPYDRVLRALKVRGFEIVRTGNHIARDDFIAFTPGGIVRDAGLSVEQFRALL